MKNSIRTVIVSTILLTIFSCTTSTDVPLPITTTSEDALELYNKAWYSWGNHDAIKQSEYMKMALEIDPDFILANLYVLENDPNKRKQFRDRAIQNKNNGSNAEKLLVEMFIAGRDGRQIGLVPRSQPKRQQTRCHPQRRLAGRHGQEEQEQKSGV